LQRAASVFLALIFAGLLWLPIPMGGGGTLGGSGAHIIRWGALGFMVVTTHLSWYGAGNVPVSREVQFSWPLLGLTLLLSVAGGWLVAWIWRRSPGGFDAGQNRPLD
jgi:hypothetical protein